MQRSETQWPRRIRLRHGTLIFTEASKKRRASLKLVAGAEVCSARSRRPRRAGRLARGVCRTPQGRQSHGEAHAHRSTYLCRHRQCVLRRNPAARALSPFKQGSALTDEEAKRLYDACRDARGMDRAIARTGRRRFPDESHRVSCRNGGARPVPSTVSGLRRAGAAHRLCGKRKQLLREVSNGGPVARRPFVVAIAEGDWPKRLEDLE